MIRSVLFCLGLLFGPQAAAYHVEEISVPSQAMDLSHRATVVLPDAYQKGEQSYPVLYLLHGHGGSFQDWAGGTEVEDLADRYQMILVMPDGAIDSWYLDSPVAEQSRYRTYIGTELVAHIDKHYRTVAEAKGRGITGLSMGGFGALHIGLNHPGQFGALASTAGGVDPRDYEGRWGLDKVLGDRRQNASFWDSMAIVNNLDKIKASGQALFIDCGLEDFFLTPNRQLHQALVRERIPHHYLEMPGGHNWQYWAKSIEYQLVFFADFFAGHNP